MKEVMECPVCGRDIEYVSYSEYGLGVVERHAYCKECGYFVEQCYSPIYEGICEGFNPQYEGRVKELGLEVVPEEFVP